MNIYEVHHDGVYLGGLSIVIAPDEARALHLAKVALTDRKISTTGVYVRRQINSTEERCHILWDGDY